MGLFLLLPSAHADTIRLSSGEYLKGLVVEEYADRLLYSTEDGEKVIMRRDIQMIEYDNPEYNFMSLGRAMEQSGQYGKALSYFKKAYEHNPEFIDAKQAVLGIKSKMWAQLTRDPTGELEKQQAIHDAWVEDDRMDELAVKTGQEYDELINERLGVSLQSHGDFVKVSAIRLGSDAYQQGLRKGDVFIRSDGKALRYMDRTTVMQELLEPRFTRITVEIQRSFGFPRQSQTEYKDLGFRIKQGTRGLIVEAVMEKSLAESVGLQIGDLVYSVNGQKTRYTPLKDVLRLINETRDKPLLLVVNRFLNLNRS